MFPSRPSWKAGLLALLALTAPSRADDAPKPITLFDGKTLEGWTVTEFTNHGDVHVEEGAILLGRGKSMTGVTTTRTDLPTIDYELSYEAKRVDGNDFFAAATFPVKDSALSFINGGWGGSVTGLSSLNGADASQNDTGRSFPFRNDVWYHFRIRVTKGAVRCRIDEKEIVAVDIHDRPVGIRIEMNRCKPLGFATWDTAGALREVTVRKLTPAEIAENDQIED